LDYVARQKIGGTHLNFFVMKPLAVLPPETYLVSTQWNSEKSLAAWIAPRVLELTYTAYDMTPFARDCGYDGEPFIWNDERRFQLRCELDAAYFHLYGINREDTNYIMSTFPIVKRKDEAKYGTYRTRDRILEIYDQMASGVFVSALDPLPAHGWTVPEDRLVPTSQTQPIIPIPSILPPPAKPTLTIVEDGKRPVPTVIEPPRPAQPQPGANIFFQRTVLGAEIVHQMHMDNTFGHVKFMKTFEIIDLEMNADLSTQYYRQAAGPLDRKLLFSLDKQLEQQQWYKAILQNDRIVYVAQEKSGRHREYYNRYWQEHDELIQRIITLFKPLTTRESEIIATLYTAWNDLLLQGKEPSEAEIILESSSEKWHPEKATIKQTTWESGLRWMQKHRLIPRGTRQLTRAIPVKKTPKSKMEKTAKSSTPELKVAEEKAVYTVDTGVVEAGEPLTLALPVGRIRVNGQSAELLEKKSLGSGRFQYRVILDATGEIKAFMAPPAQIEEVE
jgi:hypothetical protein